jgi:hypothetical protein
MHTNSNALTPALGKNVTFLMVGFLAALSSGCTPETTMPSPPATATSFPAPVTAPSPASAVAWIQLDNQGNRNVYYLSPEGKPVFVGRLIGAGGTQSSAAPASPALGRRPPAPMPPAPPPPPRAFCWPTPWGTFC